MKKKWSQEGNKLFNIRDRMKVYANSDPKKHSSVRDHQKLRHD